ncbi:hypothetical protein PAECIP111802_03101 [Paenibacillus allorhizosphaerae]|uniref:Uncharacterized protein n=1 Tax=Paenibacillus allorhizosphaerae TaxID=2849866 RepID=A0ABM8VIA9_9BACL|nr:hypothetical protein PAECIP111802_03101 [Paenibacillus allorhizosphaerae]
MESHAGMHQGTDMTFLAFVYRRDNSHCFRCRICVFMEFKK